MTDIKENIEKHFTGSTVIMKEFLKLLKDEENTDNLQSDSTKLQEQINLLLLEQTNISSELTNQLIISDEDLEGFDHTINTQNEEIEKLKEESEKLKAQNGDFKEKLSRANESLSSNNTTNTISAGEVKLKIELEGVKDRFKTLSQSYDTEREKNSGLVLKITDLEEQLNESKQGLNLLNTKYNNLLDENEINNKNLKKNFSLEKQVKDLSEEIESYKEKLLDYEQSKNLKNTNERLHSEIQGLKDQHSSLTEELAKASKTIDKLKEENFNKFDRVNSLENELKFKKQSLAELSLKNEDLAKKNSELGFQRDEHDKQIKSLKQQNDSRIRDLKNELESNLLRLRAAEKTNSELKKEAENYNHFNSMARTSKEALTKKDFSILETMSRRVEELENLNENLKAQISELSLSYSQLNIEKTKIEKNVFEFLKEEVDLTKKKMEKIEITTEESIDLVNGFSILKTKSFTNEVLLDSIITQKKQNIMLRQQLTDVTVEINKVMRNQNITSDVQSKYK